jgi:DNA-binding CsgD family transcriptional regulator
MSTPSSVPLTRIESAGPPRKGSASTVASAVSEALKFEQRSHVPYGCPLTPSQLDTLRLLSEGLTYKELALKRRCSISTVRSHVHEACSRLNVAKSAQAVLIGYRKDWLDEHAENQTSVEVRRLAEATEELVVHLQKRKHKMRPALEHYLASFDDLMLARGDEERIKARDLMEESLARVLRENGIPHRRARTHNSAFAKLLDDLITQTETSPRG